MIGVAVQVVNHFDRVEKAAKAARTRNIKRAAFLIYEDAAGSIKEAEGPSPPGKPPHTHTQKITKKGKVRKGVLPKSIVYAAEKDSAVIGPRFSVVALAGEAHEKGKDFHGEHFDKRPYMTPSLERQAPAFGESFGNSLWS